MSQIVDAILQQGAKLISPTLKERVAAFALDHRQGDGGFKGRAGSSDPYYTDFALRILALTKPEEVGPSLLYSLYDGPIEDIPELFSRLSIAELCGQSAPAPTQECLSRWRLPSGCFMRSDRLPSAYCTFLGALCEDMAGIGHWTDDVAIGEILKLQQSDGGFVDCGRGLSQTNPTCAAIGYLLRALMIEASPSVLGSMARASQFLKRMEHPNGGFLACADAAIPDLLSTFTAMVSLELTGFLDKETLKRGVRFAGSMATPNGGFRSCASDPEADVEYAYYGLGCLCLAAAKAGAISQEPL